MLHLTIFPSLLLGSFMLVATTAPQAQQTPNAGTQLQQIPASPSLSDVVQCDWEGLQALKTLPFEAQSFQFPGVGVWIQLSSR